MIRIILRPCNLILYSIILIVIAAVFGLIWVDRLCVAILFFICLIIGSKETYYLNPYFLFSITPFSLLMYINIGNIYMQNLTHKTWLLAIINIFAFIIALYYTPGFKTIKRCLGVGTDGRLIFNAIVLYIVSLFAYLIPQLASVLWLFSVPAIVCAMKSKRRIMIVFSLGVIIISFFGGTSKMAVLLNIITIIVCIEKYYVTSLKRKRLVLVLLLLSVIFMIFAFSFANKERGHYDSSTGLSYYQSRGIEWDYHAAFFLPYMYLTTSWGNLQYVTETQNTRTNGLWVIKPLLGYAQLDNLFNSEYELVPYSSFNTFTFITCGFKDFGYWMSIILSLFLGFYVKKVYTRYCISRSPLDVAIYVCVALAVAEMFFSNHFFMLSYPFTILIIMEIYKLFFGRYIEIESTKDI